MSSVTGEQSAGSIMNISLCRTARFIKATAILITRGDLCLVDTTTTPDSHKTAPASAENRSTLWVVALETVTVAEAKGLFSGCYEGPVIVNSVGNIALWNMTESDPTAAGKVKVYVTLTVSAAYAQGEVQDVRDDWMRRTGVYWGHGHEFMQGTMTDHTAGQFNDLVVIWLRPAN